MSIVVVKPEEKITNHVKISDMIPGHAYRSVEGTVVVKTEDPRRVMTIDPNPGILAIPDYFARDMFYPVTLTISIDVNEE